MSAKKNVSFYNRRGKRDNYGQPLGEFDRSISFNCFRSWVDSIRRERTTDPAKAADAFLVLADYCLYGKEPDPNTNPWGMGWEAVKNGADASIKNRSRYFRTKDIDKREKVAQYILEHPSASQREVRDAVGCSLGLVNEVAQSLRKPMGTGICSIDYNINNKPRGVVLEQNTLEEEPPEWEEVFGPHQPDAQTGKAVPVHPVIAQEGGEAY